MRFRKLRIAWSVVWGLACVLLLVLWVRSYWWADELKYISEGRISEIDSARGVLSVSYVADARFRLGGRSPLWVVLHQPIPNPTLDPDDQAFVILHPPKSFRWTNRFPFSFSARFPHWFVALLFAAAGAILWVRRFSLRALLIATTLVAVVLGLIVWSIR